MEVHDRHVRVLVVVYRVQSVGSDHDKVAFTYSVTVAFDMHGEVAGQNKVKHVLGIDVRPGRQHPSAPLDDYCFHFHGANTRPKSSWHGRAVSYFNRPANLRGLNIVLVHAIRFGK